jgi:hypothetical protein
MTGAPMRPSAEALREHGIPHDLRGDTIRFDPWHERETLRIYARVMKSGDGEILSRFDSREEAVPFLEFLAEKNIEQRSPPCDPTAVVWRPRDESEEREVGMALSGLEPFMTFFASGKKELETFTEILVEHRIEHRRSRFNDLHLVMPTVTETELQTAWEQYQQRQSTAEPRP